jgi:hypothetical protein
LGLNTLDCSSLSRGVYINLNANTYSSIGIDASGISSLENVFIGPNTKLQKVIGTNDDDVMLGNSLNDVFVPNAGNDVIKGGTGLNTVVLSKSMSQYSVGYDLPSTSWLISDNDGVSGTKTLSSVARIQFSDLNLALDLSATQAGGETAEILGAILGPAALKNPGFVGFGLNALDNGTTMNTLMQEALNYELGNNYSAAQEIALLYQNVLGTPAQSSDISYWSNFISTGKYTQTSLAIMAAQSSLNTNNINLSGLSQSGLTYTPYNLF